MKTWPFAVAGLVILALAGCRADPNVALLERENRLLEDEIYRLRGIIGDYEGGMVQGCTEVEAAETAPAQIDATRESAPGLLAPRRKKAPAALEIQPPKTEMPSESVPPEEIPLFKRPGRSKTPTEPDGLKNPDTPKNLEGPSFSPGVPGSEKGDSRYPAQMRPAVGFEPISQADSKDVGQLVLNRMLTGGYSADGKHGDSGLLVVLEPRDAKGRRLEAPADVSIVVLDPAKTGQAARLARWDFTASETAQLFCGSGVGRGMHIECPWPDKPPEHNRLHLFVRYTTSDGRKLQVDQPIEVALPGENISRWTPSETNKQSARSSNWQITSHTSDADSAESPSGYFSAERQTRSIRTASRNNAAKLKRPIWSPDRY